MKDRPKKTPAAQATIPVVDMLADLVRAIDVGVIVWHLEDRRTPRSFRLVAVNRAACRITGIPFERGIGKRLPAVLSGALRTRRPGQYREVVLSGRPRDLGEISGMSGPLRGRTISTRGYPLPGDCVALVFEDVTEAKRASAELQESQQRLRDIIDNLNAFLALLSPEGVVLLRNRPALRAFRQRLDASLGKPFADLGPWNWSPQVQRQIRTAIRRASRGERIRYDVRHRHPDGRTQDVDISLVPVGDGERGVRHIVVSGVDITERKRAEEMLAGSQRHLRRLLDSVPLPIGVLTPKGILLEGNAFAARSFGRKAGSFSGRPFWEVPVWNQSPALQEQAKKAIRRAARGENVRFDLHCLGRDGEPMALDFSLVPLRGRDGKISHLIASAADITQRVKAQEEQERSHRHVRSIVDGLPIFLALLDPQGRLRFRNRFSHSSFSTHLREVQGKPLWGIPPWNVSPDIRRLARSSVERAARGEEGICGEVDVPLPGGHTMAVEWAIAPILDASGRVTDLVASGRDVTARKRAAEERARLFDEVERGREQLRSLSRRLVELQESERRAIARELHDEIGQLLTSLRLVLERSGSGDSRKEVRVLLGDLTRRVRDLSMDLRPAMLDDLGLVPALLWHIERFSTQTGVRVHFRHRGADRRFPPEVETAAFRIVQEALTNVARHAATRDARVALRADRTKLSLRIQDEGRGFDPASGHPRDTSGLTGMQERARLLGGVVTVQSLPGAGTSLRAEIPLRTPERRA